MAAAAPPLPDLSGIDPAEVRNLNRELANFATKIRDIRPPLRMMGGFFGRQTAMLREQAERAIFLSKLSEDVSVRNLATSMEEALAPTLSFMERSAFRARQAIMKELTRKTDAEKQRQAIEDSIIEAQKEQILLKKRLSGDESEAAKQMIENSQKLVDSLMAQKETLLKQAPISDRQQEKYRRMLGEFQRAFSDSQREMIQARLDGMISGEEKVLKVMEDRVAKELELAQAQEEALKSLSDIERPIKERELKSKRDTIKLMKQEAKLLKDGIAARKKGIKDTTGEYKKGMRGFLGEVLGKSFKTGLFGALKGEGFGDIAGVAFNAIVDRSGILSKKMPKALGGASLAATFYGGESEEARREQARASARIDAMTEGAAGIERITQTESIGGPTDATESLIEAMPDSFSRGMDESELSEAALEEGSIFTHDIHLEKILADIGKALIKKWEDKGIGMGESKLSSGGKEGMNLKGSGKGIAAMLVGIATGVKRFASRDVLKGALGILSVGTSLAPFATALVALAAVPVTSLLAAIGAVGAVALGAILFGKFQGQITQGAIAIAAVGAAMIPAAFAFSLLGSVDAGSIWNAVGALAALSAIAIGLGLIAMTGVGAVGVAAGAGLLALIGVAFIPFAFGLSMLSKVDASTLEKLGPALLGLIVPIGLLAVLSPFIPMVSMGLVGLAGGVFALGLAMMIYDAKVLEAFGAFLQVFASTAPLLLLAGMSMFVIAGGLLAMGAAITATNAILGAGEIIGGIAKWLGFDPGPGIVGVINTLASQAPALMTTANALSAIADAMERIGSALNSFANGEVAMQTVDALVSLDATQLQTLQDVSIAMEKVSTANDQLKSERTEAQMMAAGGEMLSPTVVNNSSVGTNNMLFPPSGGRNPDPSIMFSRERYYSMIYR